MLRMCETCSRPPITVTKCNAGLSSGFSSANTQVHFLWQVAIGRRRPGGMPSLAEYEDRRHLLWQQPKWARGVLVSNKHQPHMLTACHTHICGSNISGCTAVLQLHASLLYAALLSLDLVTDQVQDLLMLT